MGAGTLEAGPTIDPARGRIDLDDGLRRSSGGESGTCRSKRWTSEVPSVRSSGPKLDRRGGVALDLIVGLALILLGAFALNRLGISFHAILHGASRFFGIG